MPVLGVVSGSPSAPKQHGQPSRKGRKAWRKNVDVSEVEKGLEERNKEIIEGKVIKEQASHALFRVAVEKDSEIERQIPRKFKKILKSEEIIAARSAVPAVAQRKRGGDAGSKTTDGVLSAKRQRTNYVSQKELARLRKVADGYHENTVAIVEASYDPWATNPDDNSLAMQVKGAKQAKQAKASAGGDATKTADGEDPFSFLPKPQKVKAPETLKHPPISLAANGKPVPAVAKPNGAFSYNPAFGDYEARLTEEGLREVEAEKKRIAAAEAERIRLEAVARSAAEAEEAEARAEMSEWEEDSAWEGFESGAEGAAGEDAEDGTMAAKRPKRKTPAQRNRIIRRKEAEGQKKHEAAMRHKQEQIKRMELILAEAATEALAENDDNDSDADEDEQEDMGDDTVLRRRQLGKYRLPEKDLELVLPDELQDSLRLLKPEGNLLKDRYRNLLVRGKMEVRRKRPFRKQAKTKQTEKWAHKDFLLF